MVNRQHIERRFSVFCWTLQRKPHAVWSGQPNSGVELEKLKEIEENMNRVDGWR